jgi:Spy/CpxP family protein refolding chaperone
LTFRNDLRLFCLAGLLLAVPAAVHAQRGSGGMGGGGGMGGRVGGMGGSRGGMEMPGNNGPSSMPRGNPPPNGGGPSSSSMRGGLQLGPPGRWWDDKKFAKSLGLNGDQQKRMDAVFGQNRDALLSRYQNLQVAESRLEALTHTGKVSESALFAEIDHVAQARADLEKVNTHMLLQLRDEMTADQLGKLEDHR